MNDPMLSLNHYSSQDLRWVLVTFDDTYQTPEGEDSKLTDEIQNTEHRVVGNIY